MDRYVWWTPAARRAIEALSTAHRAELARIESFLAYNPRPTRGSTFVRALRLFGKEGYAYFDNRFPYLIFYDLDENDDVVIGLVMRAFTG